MKAAQLRQSILQAAVQGKLVPQDLHDEPASELLARVKAEKSKLIKEGKIKKEKPLPPIMEDDIPQDLPNGWIITRINDLASLYDGSIRRGPFGSAIRKDMFVQKSDNAFKVYEQGNAIRQSIDYGDYYISEEQYEKLKSFHIIPGDIIISCAGTLGKTYVLPANAPKGIINQALLRLNINEAIIKIPYFLLCFQAITQQQIILSSYGSAMKNLVSIQWLKEKAIFPLPPLAEQQRIVAKVDELMALCDELEAAEKELDKLEADFAEYLPKSILQAAVQGKLVPQDLHDEPATELLVRIKAEKAKLIKEGKIKKEKPLPPISEDEIPYDLPDGWVWCRLGEICDYGSANSADPINIPDDAWLLELEDIEKDTGLIKCIVTKKNRESKSTKHVFRKGNVLYSKLRPYLNKVLIAQQDGYCTSEVLPLDFSEIDAHYAMWFMRNPLFVEYANGCSYGVKMPRLGTEDGRAALFALPPLAEQQRIVAKVDELMALCDELKTARDTSIAPTIPKITSFPAQEADDVEEIRIAARGDFQGLSDEAMRDIDELFGDEAND